MNRIIIILCVSVLWTAVSCQCGRTETVFPSPGERVTMEYSRYLTIEENDSCTVVDVLNPWKEGSLLHRYVLVPRGSRPVLLPEGTVIPVPVERMVIYSGVHACIMEELGCTDRIKGVCEPEYIFSPAIHAGIDSGAISDIGDSYSPDIEKIISLNPDIIITSPFENSSYGAAEKLGIPIVEGADYMENIPLGRTEWVKFFGMLTGCTDKADSIFRSTADRYKELAALVSASTEKEPSVISERKYGSSWGIAGRDSYMAALYRDAGGDYMFEDVPGTGSTRMTFEKVLERGIHSDIWLIKYASGKSISYDDLRSEYPPYGEFDAFKKRKIHACNTLTTPYYRDITIHPDYILEDLIQIFHPSLLPESSVRNRYFVKIP